MWTLHRKVRRTLSFSNSRRHEPPPARADDEQQSISGSGSGRSRHQQSQPQPPQPLSDGQVILRSIQPHSPPSPSTKSQLRSLIVALDGRVYSRQPCYSSGSHHPIASIAAPDRSGSATMAVSRRRILSRSRDDLSQPDTAPATLLDEEDVWYSKDKLVKDHLSEVLTKWSQIDDEIWSKVIIFERNRRVAKAYARAPVLTINGSGEGFDGFRIGLNGFSNPMRDQKTEDILKHVGHGAKLKMDDEGNVLVKRISRNGVWVRCLGEEEQGFPLEVDKAVKLFDMRAFTSKISRELRRAYPDRRKLETECIMSISFVKQDENLLNTPCWIMIINLVAMDMLKAKLPPIKGREPEREQLPREPAWQQPQLKTDIRNRPKIPLPVDEDRPPKLPPRDLNIPKPDYDDHSAVAPPVREETAPKSRSSGGFFSRKSKDGGAVKEKKKEVQQLQGGADRKYDDPYYCGLRARIPAFVQRAGGGQASQAGGNRKGQPIVEPIYVSSQQPYCYGAPPPAAAQSRYGRPAAASLWATSKGDGASLHSNPYADPISLQQQQHRGKYGGGGWGHGQQSAFESDSPPSSELYAPIYGRLPLPMRNPNTFSAAEHPRKQQQQAYVGDWE